MSVIEAAESCGLCIIGILDKPETQGKSILGYKVIGTDADIQQYSGIADFVVTVGSIQHTSIRRTLYHMVKASGGRLACVVASTARVSSHAMLGEGSVVLHHALVNAGARVGVNCIINSYADIEHGVTVGAHTHVSTHAAVNGDCCIGESSFIGSGAVMYQGVKLENQCVIAAGSVVRHHLTQSGIYAGNPAMLKI